MSDRRNKPRVYLTLQQRYDILLQLENGVSMIQLANDYNVNSMTIRRIRANAVLIRQQSQLMGIKNQKKFRLPVLHQLDMRLYSWYLHRQTLGDHVTDTMLRAKAKELNEEFGGPSSFTAARGWIWRFKRRHGIHPPKYHDEYACTDRRTNEDISWLSVQQLGEKDIELQNFHNMEEMELTWKIVPRRTVIHEGEKNTSKNNITKGRTDLIEAQEFSALPSHEYERSNHYRSRLPVIFKARRNIWTNQNEFANWFKNYFRPIVRRQQFQRGAGGKVFLLIENCKIHILPPQLRRLDGNIELVYFSADTTSGMQLGGQRVVEKMRRSFAHCMLQKILEYPDGVVEFYTNYYIKDCISLINEIWVDTIQMSICKTWSKLLAGQARKGQEQQESQRKPFYDMPVFINVKSEPQDQLEECEVLDVTVTMNAVEMTKVEAAHQNRIEECEMSDVSEITNTGRSIKAEAVPRDQRKKCKTPVTEITNPVRTIKVESVHRYQTVEYDTTVVTEIANPARTIKMEPVPRNEIEECVMSDIIEISNPARTIKVEPVSQDEIGERDVSDIMEISNTVRPIKTEVVPYSEIKESDASDNTEIIDKIEIIKVEASPRNQVEKRLARGNETDDCVIDIEFSDLKTTDKSYTEPDLDEKETQKMFSTLALWSQDQPSFIQLQVQAIQTFYHNSRR